MKFNQVHKSHLFKCAFTKYGVVIGRVQCTNLQPCDTKIVTSVICKEKLDKIQYFLECSRTQTIDPMCYINKFLLLEIGTKFYGQLIAVSRNINKSSCGL